MKIGDCKIKNRVCEKLLGVERDTNLNFNDQISGLCKNSSKKMS